MIVVACDSKLVLVLACESGCPGHCAHSTSASWGLLWPDPLQHLVCIRAPSTLCSQFNARWQDAAGMFKCDAGCVVGPSLLAGEAPGYFAGTRYPRSWHCMEDSIGVEQFALAALGVQVVFAIKVVCLAFSHRHIIKRTAQQAVKALSAPLRPASLSTEESRRFEEVRQQRFQLAPYYLACCVTVSQFVLLASRISVLEHGWIKPGAYWTTLALCLVNLGYLFNPAALTKWTVDWCYVLHMGFCAMYLTPWCVTPAQTLNTCFFLLGCIRLPAVLLASRTSLVLACNLLISVLLVVRIRTETWSPPGCDVFDSAYTILCGEALNLILTVGFGFLVDRLLHQKVRHDMIHRSAISQLGAASALLRLLCDAIVELDSNLRITDDSPQLAAMLLRDGPGSVKGMTFTDLMPTVPEAARANEILSFNSAKTQVSVVSDDSRASILANVFHTRLVDSCSSKFRTEVFQVAYSQADGEVHHLIGLRDFTDQASLAGRKAFDTMEACPPSSRASEERSSVDSDSEGSNSKAIPSNPSPDEGLVCLYIDMTGQRVMAASPTVAHMSGKGLGDLFFHKGLEMLRQVWHDMSEDQTGTALNFRNLKIRCGNDQHCKVSGHVEVVQTQDGQFPLLLHFKPTRQCQVQGPSKPSSASYHHHHSFNNCSRVLGRPYDQPEVPEVPEVRHAL